MKLFSGLFKEFIPVYIEIRGRETVLLEGYGRIESYSETEITLLSDQNIVLVRGEDLDLCHLSAERIAVKGRIKGIEFI